MKIEWLPRPAPLPGSMATVERKEAPLHVIVIPVPGSTEWLALGPSGMIQPPYREPYQSEEAARAAVEEAIVTFLAPKKRGPKAGRTARFSGFLPRPLMDAAKSEALRRGVKIALVIAEWAERGRGAQ